MNGHFFRNRKANRGISLIEVMIGLLLMTMIGMAMTSTIKKNRANLAQSDLSGQLQNQMIDIKKLIVQDFSQVAQLSPSCLDNPLSVAVTTPCSDLKVRAAITPLPGASMVDVDALTTLLPPANLEVATSTLSLTSDAVRIAVYDFANVFNCRLNNYRPGNPSATAGTAAGAERIWPLRNGCQGNLTVNGLYAMQEDNGLSVFGNIFQVTALADLGGNATSVDQLQADVLSTGNRFNQVGGMGRSGFSSAARIYPIKFVEWAFQPGQGLYRREIRPTGASALGYSAWQLISDSIEGIQFYPLTAIATEHQRTMAFTADPLNDGLEDIRAINVRVVIKNPQPSNDDQTYDNPLTSTNENDHFPRLEAKFYVDFKNLSN